jgi:hypothetical protein
MGKGTPGDISLPYAEGSSPGNERGRADKGKGGNILKRTSGGILKETMKMYRKSEEIKALETLANAEDRRRHPSIDPRYLAPLTYKDNSANGTTKCIIDYIRLTGGQAERISTTGRVIDKRKRFIDVTGKARVIGSMKWIPSSGTRGSADISAVIRGHAVKIEVKHGNDRQSDDQRAYQRAIEQAGGTYLICHSFADFYKWYNKQ